jgi:hypothetical protein
MMKKGLFLLIAVFLVYSGIAIAADSGGQGEKIYTFEGKRFVDINTVSGDCVIKPSKDDKIRLVVEYNYTPDCFEMEVDERGDRLMLDEDFPCSCNGESIWTLEVPDNTDVKFNTASGDFYVANLNVEYEVDTASGEIEVINVGGVFDLDTASGNIEVENAAIDGNSSFNTASGSVRVTLAQSVKYDLEIGSATGNAELDFNGNPIEGYFIFEADVKRGDIKSPYDFDSEEKLYKNSWPNKDVAYYRKAFARGDSGDPEIKISTATGTAKLTL